MTNHLPVKASRESEDTDWNFELDVDALVVQAKARTWLAQLSATTADGCLPSARLHRCVLHTPQRLPGRAALL